MPQSEVTPDPIPSALAAAREARAELLEDQWKHVPILAAHIEALAQRCAELESLLYQSDAAHAGYSEVYREHATLVNKWRSEAQDRYHQRGGMTDLGGGDQPAASPVALGPGNCGDACRRVPGEKDKRNGG